LKKSYDKILSHQLGLDIDKSENSMSNLSNNKDILINKAFNNIDITNFKNINSTLEFSKLNSKINKSSNSLLKIILFSLISTFLTISSILFFKNKNTVKFQHINTKNNINTSIELPDKSILLLRKNTNLYIPSNFSQNNREITMEGSAYIFVNNNNQNFTINLNQLKIIVKSCKLNLLHNSKITKISVIDGEILIVNDNIKIQLKSDENTTITNNRIKKYRFTNNTKIDHVKNIIYFDNNSLNQIGYDLSNLYNKKIIISENLKNKKFTGSFKDKSLYEILNSIKRIHYFKIEKKNNIIVLKND
jgi:ferric-dicitrate binding protein FerR (iron transport regulator)